jgi:aspartyl-tRNA(Asn)/glutamyl-tRNA(Gln) amidotransferase subunit B
LPDAKIKRFVEVLGLTAYDADVLCQDRETAAYFEVALSSGASPKLIANWIISELFSVLNKEGLTITESKISADRLAAMVKLIDDGVISGKIAKTVFTHMWDGGKHPKEVVEEQGLQQISDPAVIKVVIEQILLDNADKVVQYKAGKEQLFGFFVGSVLKHFNGKANPELVNILLQEGLK